MKTFKEFLTEGMMGININDDTNPWTDWILSGKKTIETRSTPTLSSYIGKRVGIIKTGKRKKAMLVGYATIGEPIKYETAEAFNKDYEKHRVDDLNALYNGGIKYGYPLTDVESIEPKPVHSKGIVSRKLEESEFQKFKGTYNWHNEIILRDEYTSAKDKQAAHRNFCAKIARKVGRTVPSVISYYINNSNRYTIKEG